MNPAYGSWEPGTRMRPAGAHRSGLYSFHPATEHRRRTYLNEEPIGSQHFPLPPDTAASIELWRTVVFDGVALAARDPEPVGELKSRQYQRDLIVKINEARAWITSTAFDEVCELAMLSPVPFRRAVAMTPEITPLPVKERPYSTGPRRKKDWQELSPRNPRRIRIERELGLRVDRRRWFAGPTRYQLEQRANVGGRRGRPPKSASPPPPPWSPDEPEAPPGWEWHPTY
jgi:hypothetical protein